MKRPVVIFGAILSALALLLGAITAPIVGATAPPVDWMNGEVGYEAFDATPLYPKRCKVEYRKINPVRGHIYNTIDQMPDTQVCVYKKRGFSMPNIGGNIIFTQRGRALGRLWSPVLHLHGGTAMCSCHPLWP